MSFLIRLKQDLDVAGKFPLSSHYMYRIFGLGGERILSALVGLYKDCGHDLSDTLQTICNTFHDNPTYINYVMEHLKAGDSFEFTDDFASTHCLRITSNGNTTYRAAFGLINLSGAKSYKLDYKILSLLRVALIQRDRQDAVVTLRGGDAHRALVLMLKLLDEDNYWMKEMPTSGEDSRRVLRRLMTKLAQQSGVLPASLFLHNVGCRSRNNPVFNGGFADIYKGTHKGRCVAIKRLRSWIEVKDVVRQKTTQDFKQECLIWRFLSHPNIVPLLGVNETLFSEGPCMVSPWSACGNLKKHMGDLQDNGTPASASQMNRWILQIAGGLAYLHTQGIVHGDLCPNNVLVNENGIAQVADFGLAVYSDGGSDNFGVTHSKTTSRRHAPEILNSAASGLQALNRLTFAVDVYAFACVCVEVYTSKEPLRKRTDGQVSDMTCNQQRPEQPSTPQGVKMDDAVWKIVNTCWAHLPEDRPTMVDVHKRLSLLESSWR